VQVSPHEFLQAVVRASNKRFLIDRQGDPVEFLAWFLHELHRCVRTCLFVLLVICLLNECMHRRSDLGGTKQPGSSSLDHAFQVRLLCDCASQLPAVTVVAA
jgi:hypothetical protein